LKTPRQYVRASRIGPPRQPTGSGPVLRGGAATRDRTAVLPQSERPADSDRVAERRSASRKPAADRVAGVATVVQTRPMRVLVGVLSLALGGYITLYLARSVGWLNGDRMIDVLTGSGVTRYLRLFSVVPVWALLSAAIATGVIELARRLAAPRSAAGSRARPGTDESRSTSRRTAPLAAARRPAPAGEPDRRPERREAGASTVRARESAPPRPLPRRAPLAPPPEPTAPEPGQRPRRIPRRDSTS
jgi:hypothetical protein